MPKKRGYPKSNAVQRIKTHMQKKVPNKAHAGPSIRPDERTLQPATPGKSRPVYFDYNLQPPSRYPRRFKQP